MKRKKKIRFWRDAAGRNDCILLFKDGVEFILFDTETTGLDPSGYIIELSAIRLKSHNGALKETGSFNSLIRPPEPVSARIEEVTHITNEMLDSAPAEKDIFPEIFRFFGPCPVVAAYNVPFDVAFMRSLYNRHGKSFNPIKEADILPMAYDLVPNEKSEKHNLGAMIDYFGLDDGLQFHRAMEDVKATLRLLYVFKQEYAENPYRNGTLRPLLRSCGYFNGKSHKQTAIYIKTEEGDSIRYSFYQHAWGVSGNLTDLSSFDMEYIQTEVLNRLSLSSMSELHKMKEKDVEERRKRFWYQKGRNYGYAG